MVVIGLEQLGVQEFLEGNFFEGDVFVDRGKKTYQDLGYKRYNFLSIWAALLTKITRAAISETRAENISGNLSGDGLQNGGTLIVNRGGSEVLLNYHEEAPGDHVSNEVILEALSIKEVVSTDSAVDQEQPTKPEDSNSQQQTADQ